MLNVSHRPVSPYLSERVRLVSNNNTHTRAILSRAGAHITTHTYAATDCIHACG